MPPKKQEKDIYIPHLNYTVRVREAKNAPEGLVNALAWVISEGQHECTLYLEKGKPHAGDVAHEIIHILQFICLNRNIDFKLEFEHMGYLMQWLLGQVMEWEWKLK